MSKRSRFLYTLKNWKIDSRMMQLFLANTALDTISIRGKGSVKHGLNTAKGQLLIQQFEFTPKNKLLKTLYNSSSFDWSTQQLAVVGFNPSSFKIPQAATHVGIRLGVLDFDFDSLQSHLATSS